MKRKPRTADRWAVGLVKHPFSHAWWGESLSSPDRSGGATRAQRRGNHRSTELPKVFRLLPDSNPCEEARARRSLAPPAEVIGSFSHTPGLATCVPVSAALFPSICRHLCCLTIPHHDHALASSRGCLPELRPTSPSTTTLPGDLHLRLSTAPVRCAGPGRRGARVAQQVSHDRRTRGARGLRRWKTGGFTGWSWKGTFGARFGNKCPKGSTGTRVVSKLIQCREAVRRTVARRCVATCG